MSEEGIFIEFDDKTVTMERRGKKVIFTFGNEEDAQKCFIGYSEAARLGSA